MPRHLVTAAWRPQGKPFPWGQGHTGQATAADGVEGCIAHFRGPSGEGQGGEENNTSRWAVRDEGSHL